MLVGIIQPFPLRNGRYWNQLEQSSSQPLASGQEIVLTKII